MQTVQWDCCCCGYLKYLRPNQRKYVLFGPPLSSAHYETISEKGVILKMKMDPLAASNGYKGILFSSFVFVRAVAFMSSPTKVLKKLAASPWKYKKLALDELCFFLICWLWLLTIRKTPDTSVIGPSFKQLSVWQKNPVLSLPLGDRQLFFVVVFIKYAKNHPFPFNLNCFLFRFAEQRQQQPPMDQ